MRVAYPGPQCVPIILDCAMSSPTPPKQFDTALELTDLPAQLLEF
jgi:hypothetical protein